MQNLNEKKNERIKNERTPVGPAPPPLKLERPADDARQAFREHNLRLARSLGRNYKTSSERGDELAPSWRPPVRASSIDRRRQLDEPQLEEIYQDFDSIYAALCAHQPREPARGQAEGSAGAGWWSLAAANETAALAHSMAGVEEALKQAVAPGAGQPQRLTLSPTCSLQRADSCTTNQSSLVNGPTGSGGPALVEEMTLSDLEDEICSTLMAAKDEERRRRFAADQQQQQQQQGQLLVSGQLAEQLVCGRRSRAPLPAHLFAPQRLGATSSTLGQY